MNKEQKIKELEEELQILRHNFKEIVNDFEQRIKEIKNSEDEFDLEKQIIEIDNAWIPNIEDFQKANKAQSRLIKLMALPEFNGDHVFDWCNTKEQKYCLYLVGGVWDNVLASQIKHFLTFQTKEKAELFIKRYKSIMEDYKPLA